VSAGQGGNESAGDTDARPLVSAIVPAFNRAATVGRAIDSILGQTYPRVEVIVVDDGSVDETPRVLEGYGDRIRAIRQENAGPSAARNRGIREARGEIVTFLDSDDEWRPTKIARQVDLLARAGPDVACCICDTTMRYADGVEKRAFDESALRPPEAEGLWTNVLSFISTRFLLFNQAAAVRRSALVECGGFDEGLRIMEDYDLALKLAALGPWAYLDEPLVLWHGGAENSLSESAYRDPERLYVPLVEIIGRALASDWPLDASTRFFLRTRRRIARAEIAAARLRRRGSAVARATAALVAGLARTATRALRHAPGYPQVESRPLPPA